LIQDQVIRYLLVYFLNQTLIDLIPFQVIFFNIRNTNQFSFATWLFILKPFSKLKNTKNKSNVNFNPELRGFDPSRVRRQWTLVLPNQ